MLDVWSRNPQWSELAILRCTPHFGLVSVVTTNIHHQSFACRSARIRSNCCIMNDGNRGLDCDPPERSLVDKLHKLFKAASGIVDSDGHALFTTGKLGRTSAVAVRSRFIDTSTYSNWTRAKFADDSRGSQLRNTDRFLDVLRGLDLEEQVKPEYDPKDGLRIYELWLSRCQELLLQTIDDLERYATYLKIFESERSIQEAMVIGRADTKAVQSAQNNAVVTVPVQHIDLSPPPIGWLVKRAAKLADLASAASRSPVVSIEGLSGSGKTDLVNGFFHAQTTEDKHVLWYPSTSGSGLNDLFLVLASRLGSPGPDDVSRIRSLLDWLAATQTTLVIDDFERVDVVSYTPLIQLALREQGPALVVLISNERIRGAFRQVPLVSIEGFTRQEAKEFLEHFSVHPSDDELRALEETCAFIPAFMTTFVELYKQDASILNPHVLREQFGLTDAVQGWVGRLIEGLREEELLVLEHLALCDAPFDRDLISWVISKVGYGLRSAELMEALSRPFLLRRSSMTKWKVREPLIEGLRKRIDQTRDRSMRTILGDFYYRKWASNGILQESLSYDDLIALSLACQLFQGADARFFQKRNILDRISGALRQHGLHRMLISLLRKETKSNPRRNPWWDLRLAQSHLALGEVKPAFDVLEPLITSVLLDPSGSPNMQLAFLRTFADMLIYVSLYDVAERILENALRIFDTSKLRWNIVSHAKSILSWAHLKNGRVEESLKINLALVEDAQQAGATIGCAVAKTRIGVGYYTRNHLSAAVLSLEEACNLFVDLDKRGLAWASMHHAYALSRSGDREKMELALFVALRINSEYGFGGENYFSMCNHFLTIVPEGKLRDALESERLRLLELEGARNLGEHQIERADALEAVLLMVSEGADSPTAVIEFEHKALTNANARKMSSQLYKTFARSAAKADPIGAVEKLFHDHPPRRVFSTPLFSRILTEASKRKPQLATKYIIPNLSLIQGGTDSVKLHYARYFEGSGDRKRALQLLRAVKYQDCFAFHNLMANCYSKANFNACERHNKSALHFAYGLHQRVRVLTNMAMAIYEHNRRELFAEAVKLSEEAVSLRYSPKFHWPSDILLILRLEMCSFGDIGPELEKGLILLSQKAAVSGI